MSFTPNTGEYKSSRSDVFMVDPRALVIDWKKNLSRGGTEPPVDDDLISLALDMVPKKGHGDSEDGTSGQINPITVRPLSDRRLELIGGFRRARAALHLIESGTCPDFQVKVIISRLNDAEAALVNMAENIHRSDPKPIELAHAVRQLTEDYGLPMATVAGRLKRSPEYLSQLIGLLMLPTPVQQSIEAGDTTVTAGLELAKVPPSDQSAVFSDAKDSNGKVKATAVKKVARKKAEEKAESAPANPGPSAKPKSIRRSLKDVENFLEGKCGPGDPESGRKFADSLLAFIDGKATERQMDNAWDRAFGR